MIVSSILCLQYARYVNGVHAPTATKRKANGLTPKKGTIGAILWNLLDKYLSISKPMISRNNTIHRAIDVKDWVIECGFEIIYFLS